MFSTNHFGEAVKVEFPPPLEAWTALTPRVADGDVWFDFGEALNWLNVSAQEVEFLVKPTPDGWVCKINLMCMFQIAEDLGRVKQYELKPFLTWVDREFPINA